MSDFRLTKTRFVEGVWVGLVTRTGDEGLPPEIEVTHLGQPLDKVSLREGEGDGEWVLRIALPPSVLTDGVQTVLISDARSGEVLGKVGLICGDALDEDIRAEMDLLRAELDLLKRAFRRHCVETA